MERLINIDNGGTLIAAVAGQHRHARVRRSLKRLSPITVPYRTSGPPAQTCDTGSDVCSHIHSTEADIAEALQSLVTVSPHQQKSGSNQLPAAVGLNGLCTNGDSSADADPFSGILANDERGVRRVNVGSTAH